MGSIRRVWVVLPRHTWILYVLCGIEDMGGVSMLFEMGGVVFASLLLHLGVGWEMGFSYFYGVSKVWHH